MSSNLFEGAAVQARNWAEQALNDSGCGIPNNGATGNTDSPIEAQLLVAVAIYYRLWGEPLTILAKGSKVPADFYDGPKSHTILLIPQFQVSSYRVDFALFCQSERAVKVIVECDGHALHERTKEQAQKDKSRDRDLQSLGYKVIRFTGSEIYRDPFAAASEVLEIVQGAMQDVWLAR